MASLYLAILAFFVMLVALSQRDDDRIRTVLASLGSAFPARTEASAALLFDAALDPAPTVLRAEEVRSLLAPALPLRRARMEVAGDAVRLLMPADAVFLPGGTDVRADRNVLLSRIADVLRAAGHHGVGRLRLRLGTDGKHPASTFGTTARLRVIRLRELLTELGAPAGLITLGLAATGSDVVFTFDAAGSDLAS